MKELKQAYNEQLELKSDENAALLDQLNEMARRGWRLLVARWLLM